MSNDNEIVVQLTAEEAQLQAGMEAGAASVAKATEEMRATVASEAAAFNAAVQTKIDAMVQLNTAFAGGITSTEGIAEAEAALDQAMAAGAVSAAEYASYVGKLDAAEVDLAASTQVATAAVDENTTALTINGGVAREVGVLIGELARGNYTRLEGSTVTLANRTGMLSSALQFLLSPMGMAAEVATALGVAAYEASKHEEELRDSIINSGDIAGYNADQLRTMEESLRETGATAGQAREAIVAATSSGKLLGSSFQDAAQAAVDMAQLTGVSVQKAVDEIAKLEDNPVKSIQKLNDSMNFLSPAEAAEIKHLSDIGDKAGAAALAISDLADAEDSRVKKQRDAGDGTQGFAGGMKKAIGTEVAWVEGLFSPATLDAQLKDVNEQLESYAAAYKGSITQDTNNAIKLDSTKLPGAFLGPVNELLEKRKELEAQITAEGAKQQEQSRQAIADKEKVNATLSAPTVKVPTAGHADHEQAQADRDAYNEQRLQHSMSLAEEKTYWQAKLAAAKEGSEAYRQAVNELLQIKSKEASDSKAEARQEISDAKHIAAEKVRAAKEAERAAQEAATKRRELSLEQIKATHDEAIGSIANKREQYQQEYSDGQISAAQLLQLESDLMTQKLAADRAYYEAKAKLDAADPIAVTKDDAGIVKSQQDALASMLRYEKEFHNNSMKEWQSYARKAEGSMQTAVNGMLFQQETLRKALAGIAETIAEDFIQKAVFKPMENWIMGQNVMTSATSVGTAQRAIIEDAAAQRTKVADAATGKSQITSAAATGAAKAYQAIVGIPYVGPILAPIAAGVAYAGIEEFSGKLSSARGGWERVPIDGMMTELHKDEMVLPAHIAGPVRDMAQRGTAGQGSGGGGGDNYHFHSFDSRGIFDHARRNPRDFAAAMKHVSRRGHL